MITTLTATTTSRIVSRLVEHERDNKRVSSRQFIGGYGDDEDDGFDEEDSPY